MLSDKSFLRYQRQIALPEVGEEGQEALSHSHVLIIGCGGLGSAAGLYLAASGVGNIVLVDDDKVEESNLQRQVVYREGDLSESKSIAMSKQLKALNQNVSVRTLEKRLSDEQLSLEVMLADIVLDCCDNMESRHQIARTCFEKNTPLVTGSAIGWNGQFSVFDRASNSANQGCYRCLCPFDHLPQKNRCSESGVIGPVVGVIGNYQALAAIQKLATGSFNFSVSCLHTFDGMSLEWQKFNIAKDKNCDVCSQSEVLI